MSREQRRRRAAELSMQIQRYNALAKHKHFRNNSSARKTFLMWAKHARQALSIHMKRL